MAVDEVVLKEVQQRKARILFRVEAGKVPKQKDLRRYFAAEKHYLAALESQYSNQYKKKVVEENQPIVYHKEVA